MPSLKLFHRNPAKPTLRERAASMKAGLAHITRRAEPQEADAGRRSVVVGTLAAAVPLPALALPSPTAAPTPHPDQALLDAEAGCLHAEAAAKDIETTAGAACAGFRAALGPFPTQLLMSPWETRHFGAYPGTVNGYRLPTHLIHHEERLDPDFGWTAAGLQRAIEFAPSLFGRAGQTPHRIRRWRALLPIAAAYDTRHDTLKKQFRVRELRAEEEAAAKVARRARARLARMPATTIEGLAVHTRTLADTPWYNEHSRQTALLLSAAAITGVVLRQSDFDVPAWVTGWEKTGGRIFWYADRGEWAFVYPPRVNDRPETAEAVRLLINEKSSNSAVIYQWLDDHAFDPRFAHA
jgi:hypothetical protein